MLYVCEMTASTYVIVSIKKTYNSRETNVVVCTYLSGKELHRQVYVDIVVTSGSLHGVMVRTLAWNDRDVSSVSSLGTIFPIFITPATLYININELRKC